MIPLTPEVALDVAPISIEENLMPYPFLVNRIIGSSLTKQTDTNSSPSLILIAAIPVFFFVLTYSSKVVFLTKPFFVVKNTYLASVSL